MLKISRKALLAVEAVVDIAIHGRPDPVQAKEVTARQCVPQRYLEPVMQHLVREGILRGVRGPKGGYRLAKERRRITVAEIVRAVDSLESPEEEGCNSEIGRRAVDPLVHDLTAKLLTELEQVTIEDLCLRAAPPAQQDSAPNMDFTI